MRVGGVGRACGCERSLCYELFELDMWKTEWEWLCGFDFLAQGMVPDAQPSVQRSVHCEKVMHTVHLLLDPFQSTSDFGNGPAVLAVTKSVS